MVFFLYFLATKIYTTHLLYKNEQHRSFIKMELKQYTHTNTLNVFSFQWKLSFVLFSVLIIQIKIKQIHISAHIFFFLLLFSFDFLITSLNDWRVTFIGFLVEMERIVSQWRKRRVETLLRRIRQKYTLTYRNIYIHYLQISIHMECIAQHTAVLYSTELGMYLRMKQKVVRFVRFVLSKHQTDAFQFIEIDIIRKLKTIYKHEKEVWFTIACESMMIALTNQPNI